MDKQEFQHRLIESTKKLIDFTSKLVKNSISNNVEYLIEPSSRLTSDHLNDDDLKRLRKINAVEGKYQYSEQVVNLLYDSGLVPLWIDMEVYKSSKKRTIVRLLCSRRFRNDSDLNYKVSKFPPFSIKVALPPWAKKDVKFNINWRHNKIKHYWHKLTWKWQYKRRMKSKKSNRNFY